MLAQVSPGAAHNSLTQDSPGDHIFTSFENEPGHLMGFYAPHTRRHWARGQRETRTAFFQKPFFLHPADFAGGSF